MPMVIGYSLVALFVATAALSAVMGVPVYGTNIGHDSNFALSAIHSMDAAWSVGQLWPRWIMDGNFGLGATTFYTYPPLAYWVAVAVRRICNVSVPTALGLAVLFWRLAFLLGTYLWLRRHVASAPALAAAALAGLMPYAAVINPWVRFAYAEVAAAAIIPVLLLMLERVIVAPDNRPLPGLALAFAALAMTHLPTCVLVGHLIPLYAWAYGGVPGLRRCLVAGALGAGLAGCFLIPAYFLLSNTSTDHTLGNINWYQNLLFWGLPTSGLQGMVFISGVWGSAGLALLAALIFRRYAGRRGSVSLAPAALILLLSAAAIMTVLTLPLWWFFLPLRAIQFPWRAAGLLSLPLAVFAALAMTRRRRAGRVALVLGSGCAALVPLFLLGMIVLGNPGWPRFLPATERMTRALGSPRGWPLEHFPAGATEAGWDVLLSGSETAPAPDPHPRPTLPAGTQRLANGYLLPIVSAPVTLPQFWFPAWRATDDLGKTYPVIKGRDGFAEVIVDRPSYNIRVSIALTASEWAGWLTTLQAAIGILLLSASANPRKEPNVEDSSLRS